jgi:hypothetical protein
MMKPVFTFRLDSSEAASLKEIGRIYGSPSTSAFLREMVGSIVSGEPSKVAEFQTKLFEKLGGQLVLEFTAAAQKQRLKARKRSKRGKPRGKR